jgi:hypothetical protein
MLWFHQLMARLAVIYCEECERKHFGGTRDNYHSSRSS